MATTEREREQNKIRKRRQRARDKASRLTAEATAELTDEGTSEISVTVRQVATDDGELLDWMHRELPDSPDNPTEAQLNAALQLMVSDALHREHGDVEARIRKRAAEQPDENAWAEKIRYGVSIDRGKRVKRDIP